MSVNNAVAVMNRLDEAQAELDTALRLEREARAARDMAALAILPEEWEYQRAKKIVFLAKARAAKAAEEFEKIPLSELMDCAE